MRNLRDFFKRNNRYDGVYDWTPISEAFYKIIKRFAKKHEKILEFGSSTGHISYQLAKEGYNITLLDIRKEPIKVAKKIFQKKGVRANFLCKDIFQYSEKYEMAWNSGLIQCFDNEGKDRLIKKMMDITNKLLLFYPDTEDANKKRGNNLNISPGVSDAKEYDIKEIPVILYRYYDEILHGILDKKVIKLGYNMYWIHARKEY